MNAAGEAFACGLTSAPGLPTTIGAYQRVPVGPTDAFVTRLDATGAALVSSTLLGGTEAFVETCGAIAVNAGNEAFVTGWTDALDFPVTAPALQGASRGRRDAFVTRLDPGATGLVYSTYLGGASGDEGRGIALNCSDEAFVSGYTESFDFPVTPGAIQETSGGAHDLFVSHVASGGDAFGCGGSTYLGGAADDYSIPALAWAGADLVLTATSHSLDFPIRDRFGVSGPSADVYQPTKPNLDEDVPVALRLGVGTCSCPPSLAMLRRGPIDTIVPGWKAARLPLTSANDDRTAPFPIAVTPPGSAVDPIASPAALVLYRVLDPADADLGNRLRVVKRTGGPEISY